MYKQMQVYTGVKTLVQDIKKERKLKNESEVIAYLAAIREIYKDKISLTQHEEALERMKEIINQGSL